MAVSSLNCFKVSRLLFNPVSKHLKPNVGLKRYSALNECESNAVTPRLRREFILNSSTTSKYLGKEFASNEDTSTPKIDEAGGGSNQDTKDDKNKQKDSGSNFVKYSTYASGVSVAIAGSYLVYKLGSPQLDENGVPIEDEFSSMPPLKQFYERFISQIYYYKKMAQEPSREKLLPDPLTYPYIQPPYTLILELTDLLVHPEWTYQTGWRFKKRPGVDHFLEQVAPPLFEVVVFTAEAGMTAFPILDALDPNGYIMYRLVRDATHFVDGHHVKNLNCLNRDLKKVIVVDWNSESVKFHKSNSIIVPRWQGNDDDLMLVDLAAFLKTIATAKVDDVRETLEYYQQFDNPVEAFRENQRKLMEQIEEKQRLEREKPNLLTSRGSWNPSFLHKKPQ
ncbi:UNVERIFIED_CONTAM: hypothetical protein PYX00_008638 [Menopon gallinae]|uniref:Mitochondrial import inner membrane translocase subunit TIM50 n=1 Tax=Menopon gallinae TaxID=328185 RepID=A0AAW2HQ57_9NEOP